MKQEIKAHMPIHVETIRYWMDRRGLNQTQLSKAIGVTQAAISYMLGRPNGGARIEFATGLAIAAALDIDADLLLAPPPAQNTTPAALVPVGVGDTEA